ncbi:MAG TPA: hypothetical protein VFI73_01225 [Candidatus Nitrosopolaris sp.]|nr:hypothetical protein [Candidatus Nitrosopolaris sp.]
MVASGRVGDLVENAVEKSIRIQLDVMRVLLRNDEIKWGNLGIQNEADFLKGQLLAEILYDFASNFQRMHKRVPNPTEILEAHKIIIGRAVDIKRAIAESIRMDN